MFEKPMRTIKCILGYHDTIYKFPLPPDNRKVYQCKRCKAYFLTNGYNHKRERIRIIFEKAV